MEKRYRFKRYRDGTEMAQGCVITRAKNKKDALDRAKKLFPEKSCKNDTFKLYRT